MPNKTKILFTLLFLYHSYLINGQNQVNLNPKIVFDKTQTFENFTINDGLPSNRILDIIQDRFGYYWIATEAGLSRFDGKEFVNFYHDSKDNTTLSNNSITRITEDSEGELWIGTRKGLNKLNRKDYSFKKYQHNPYNQEGLPGDYIKAFLPDTSGILWLETANGFFSKFNTSKNTFQNFGHREANKRYPCHAINKLKNGSLVITGRNIFPLLFNPKNNQLKEIESFDNFLHKGNISTIYEEKNGQIWVGNSGYKLYIAGNNFSNPKELQKVSSIYDIVEDENGLLWMGGWGNGLACFNKTRDQVTVYRKNLSNSKSLPSNHINKLYIDKSGNLWLATNGGLSKLPKERAIQHIKNPKGSNYFTSIIRGKQDSILWLSTPNEGLYKYNLNSGKFTNNWRYPKLAANRIESLHLDKNGILWIGLWAGKGFNSLNPETGEINKYQACSHTGMDWWSSILETKKGDLYFGSWGLGPKRFDNELNQLSEDNLGTYSIHSSSESKIYKPEVFDDKIIHKAFNSVMVYDPASQSYQYLNAKKKDKDICLNYANPLTENQRFLLPWKYREKPYSTTIIDSSLYFATPSGIYEVLASNYSVSKLPLKLTNDTIINLSCNTNKELYLASKKKLYKTVTPFSTSIVLSDLPHPLKTYENIRLINTTDRVIIHNKKLVYCFKVENNSWKVIDDFSEEIIDIKKLNESIYIATRNQLLKLKQNGTIDTLKIDFPNRSFIKNINTIAILSEDLWWIGTDNGLFKIDFPKKEITPYFNNPKDSTSLLHNKIYQIDLDKNNNLWIGTSKGLTKFDYQNQKFEKHNVISDKGISSHLTICMFEDNNENIWIGNSEGMLDRYEPKNEKFFHYLPNPLDPNALRPDELQNSIHCVYESKKGEIWIGGATLALFDKKNNDFAHFSPKSNNPFNVVLSITEDEQNNLWLGTNKGLYNFNTKTNTFSFYGLNQNIQGLDYTRAACKLPSGEIIVGGSNGFNIITPTKISSKVANPVLKVSRFISGEDYYKNELPDSTQINLESNQNSFSLDINLIPANGQFKYNLGNFEESWTTQSIRTPKISYNNLPSGTYKLQIVPSNNSGGWQNKVHTYSIIIAQPFYQNWIFLLLSLLLFLSLLYWIFNRWNQRQIIEKEKNLQLQFLQVKSLQSQMNPHFVFNVLGSMQNLILNNEPRAANNNLVKLSTLIRRFLDSSVSMELPNNTYSHEISLEEEEELLKMYIEFEQLQYKNTFEYSLEIGKNINKGNFTLPPMIIQPYIENSIKHGLLYKKSKGFLNIDFQLGEEEILTCTIEDDGVGRKKANEIQEQSVSRFKSHGTKLVARRIEILNQMGYDIQIKTKDRPQGGTIVTIKINRNYDD